MKEKIKIGLPVSPATLEESNDYPCAKITMSDDSVHYVIEDIHDGKSVMREYKTYDDRKVQLNEKHAVWAEAGLMVEVVTDTTEHANYHRKKLEKQFVTEYHWLPSNKDYEIVKRTLGSDAKKYLINAKVKSE
jgi:dGTP triphosphohydrolase